MQVTNLPGGEYVQGANVLTTPVTIQGTIMSGSVSVPESAVTALPTPVQPPAPVIEQKVVVEKQIILVTPPIIVVEPPKKQELALGFAKNVTLREPYEFLNEEPAHHRKKRVDPDDLPEVERSALELSRIHPGLHGRP